MVTTISYFITFGIISIASGKSARYEEDSYNKVTNENELQRLLLSLANQASYDGPSNYEEVVPNTYQEYGDGPSQYNKKPRKVYYQQYKANPQQYYKSYENADEDKPNHNSLQIINRFLTQNGDNAGYDNAQNLLEDLLSLDRKTKFKPMKHSHASNNNDEVLAVLGNLQTNPSDVEYYRVLGKGSDNNLKPKKLLLGTNNDQPDDVLIQGKDGIMALFGNIVGKKYQNNNPDYYNNLNYENQFISLDDKDDDNVRDDQRCNGKNCARTNRAVNSKNRLRCNGKNCARSKTTIRSDSKPKAQKIKLNDELDAVVLQLSDVDHLLSKLYPPKSKQSVNKLRANKNLNSLQNVDLQSLLSSKNNIGKKTNVEAVVFDLTKVENGADVAKQIKRLLSKDSDDEYEEYGNLVEDNLKQGIYDLQQDIAAGKDNVKIIAQNENTNYVYLPQWLVKEAKSYGPGILNPVEVPSKLSLPSTRQQKTKRLQLRKAKHFRRNLDQDVGVPFHLEVEGLGQVNP